MKQEENKEDERDKENKEMKRTKRGRRMTKGQGDLKRVDQGSKYEGVRGWELEEVDNQESG